MVLTTLAPATVYVNDDWTDAGTVSTATWRPWPTNRPRSATTPSPRSAALAALDATTAATVVVNPGTYDETVTLAGAQAVAVQLVQGDSTITGLPAATNDTLALGGFDGNHTVPHTLTLGGGRLGGRDLRHRRVDQEHAGTLTLSGANTFAGGATVNAGTLNLQTGSSGGVNINPLGTGSLTVNDTATVIVSQARRRRVVWRQICR